MATLRILKQSAAAIVAVATLACGSGSLAATPGAWQPSEDDMLLLQIRVDKYKLLNEIRGYQTPSGACMDLADVIQSLDLPIRLDKKSRRATGWFFAEDQTFTLDREQNSVQIMNKRADLGPGEIYDTPEGWCVDLAAFSRWSGADFRLDMANSVIVLDSKSPLPFIEAIRRKSRAARIRPEKDKFDLSQFEQAELPYKAWRMPAVDAIIRLGFTDGANGFSRRDFKYELFASGEVASASYDVRFASDSDGKPSSLRIKAYRFDPDGDLLGPLKATQIIAGDVDAFSGQLAGGGGVGRGAAISNQPLNRPTRFATTTLRGTLPTDWDAEVYRNGQLLAYQGDRSDGRYEFDVDLVYGMNDLDVVLYGPQGQVRHDRTSIPVGASSLKPGQTEYWAMALEEGRDLIGVFDQPDLLESGWRYGVGVERGLDKRTSLGMSAHSLIYEGRRRHFVEFNLQRAVGPMLLELSAAQEMGRGRAYHLNALGRFGNVNFQAESLYVDGGYASQLVSDGVRSEHRLRFDSSLRLGKRQVPLQVAFHQRILRNGRKVNDVLTRASVLLRRLTVTAGLSYAKTEGADSSDDGIGLSLLANTQLAGFRLRGEARYKVSGPQKGMELARARVERNLGERSELKFEFEHDRDDGYSKYSAGYVHQFRQFSVEGFGSYTSDGALGAGLTLSFSMGPDPTGRGVRFSNEKLARTGQAGVSVFLDEDGDGRRSAGDKPLPDVLVSAGFESSTDPTDQRGRAVVEGLKPYQPVLVSIDETTLPDPYLRPASKGIVVTPRPGVTARVELAVTPTGEIEGVLYGVSNTPVEGAEIQLVNQRGQVAASGLSEFDGYFLLDRVPYGKYNVRLSDESARILKVHPMLAEGLTLGKGADLLRLGTIKLLPAGDRLARGEPGRANAAVPQS